jgi:cGMP-dependent protein kinase 1
MPLKKLEILSNNIQKEKYENGETIITQGEEGSKFYIIKSGKVDIYVNDNYIRTLNEGENFGERALFLKENRSATALANGKVELFYLEKDDFLTLIESNMKEHLLNRLYLQDSSIELRDLDYIMKLGSGNYGTVSLVQSKRTKFKYAIKVISKKQIDHDILHKNLELERAILLQIDHPFIVKLVKTIKDDKHIYFLMEYIRGKDLFEIIREIGLLSRYQTQFYGASIMLAVDYLHDRNYIYRDIKPENIMVTDTVRKDF